MKRAVVWALLCWLGMVLAGGVLFVAIGCVATEPQTGAVSAVRNEEGAITGFGGVSALTGELAIKQRDVITTSNTDQWTWRLLVVSGTCVIGVLVWGATKLFVPVLQRATVNGQVKEVLLRLEERIAEIEGRLEIRDVVKR